MDHGCLSEFFGQVSRPRRRLGNHRRPIHGSGIDARQAQHVVQRDFHGYCGFSSVRPIVAPDGQQLLSFPASDLNI